MSDFLVTNGNNKTSHPFAKRYQNILAEHGYTTLEKSVHGKNQTRFLHFILEKNGQKYFSKANLPDQYDVHINAGLVSKLTGKMPAHVQFLAPLDVIEADDAVFHIYHYINQRPVSNEEAGFTDFLVSAADIDLFLRRTIDAIKYVASQQLVTANEQRRAAPIQKTVVGLLKKLPMIRRMRLSF
jgi:hypothetical protein